MNPAGPFWTEPSSGFPHAHRTCGTPYWSTSTAVPACSTAWNGVANPPANPWLVTAVSARSDTGVNDPRYPPMSPWAIPSAIANAAPRSGFAARYDAIPAPSHAFCIVPP